MAKTQALLLIGCGSMGSALLRGWIASGVTDSFAVHIIDPSPRGTDAGTGKFPLYPTLAETPAELKPDVLLFAVKPQHLGEMLPAYAERFKNAKPLIISIAAGKTNAFFMEHFGAYSRVIRAMPNTPAMIGQGMTVLCPNPVCAQAEIDMAQALMSAVGACEVLEEESLMDAVTALSGSGPAYVFYFMEALAAAGVEAGLPMQLAEKLAAQTVRGSALLQEKSGERFEELRRQVTSPGGTTEAALRILMSDEGLSPLLKATLQAAIERSKAMAK